MNSSPNETWHILMVDDDPDDHWITRDMLRESQGRKFELDWAPTFQAGRDALHARRYDAVLVDYDLGPENGIVFIRWAVAECYPAPLILFTGRGNYEVDNEAMEAGATLYLTKNEANPLLLERVIRYAIERKRIEEELVQSRQETENESRRLEAVFEALPVGVAIVDAQGGVVTANRFYERVWGGRPPETRSIDDYRGYHARWAENGQTVQPEEWASAQAIRQARLVAGQVLEIDRFDGSRAFVLNSAAPVLNAQGQVVGGAVAIQDISAQIQAEKDLTETTRRQALLSEAAAELLAGANPIARLDIFFQRVSESLGLEVYVQYNVSADGSHLELGKLAGFPEKYHKVLARLEFGQAVCGTVAQTRRPMYVDDVQHSTQRTTRLIRKLGIGTYACHPLIVNECLLGTLSFGSRTLTHFDPQTIELLRTFCSLVATAMKRKQDEQALRRANEQLHEPAGPYSG